MPTETDLLVLHWKRPILLLVSMAPEFSAKVAR
jgi:hypothetical protein